MYKLYIGNKNYSSWSLRPWVLMTMREIPFEESLQVFRHADNFEAFRQFSPSGTVPCLVDGDTVVWDSLAIVEYLAERHPGVWPQDPAARAFARSIAAEMHSGFSSLRNICPMNCAIKVRMKALPDSLEKDLNRIDEIWQEGLQRYGGDYLAGAAFTAADAFYAPVVFRIASYQLPVSMTSLAYCQRILGLEAVRQWDAAAIAEPWVEVAHEAEAQAAGEIIEDRRNR